jgi:hypothetical protein
MPTPPPEAVTDEATPSTLHVAFNSYSVGLQGCWAIRDEEGHAVAYTPDRESAKRIVTAVNSFTAIKAVDDAARRFYEWYLSSTLNEEHGANVIENNLVAALMAAEKCRQI